MLHLLLYFLFCLCESKINLFSSSPPPPPFDVSGGVTVIRYGNVYAPQPLGKLDIVLSDQSVLSLLKAEQTDQFINALTTAGIVVKVVNASGAVVVPGLIDVHVHAFGGGGEMGPASRTPEGPLSKLVAAGITTLVGILGTDGVTRDHRQLLQKLNELDDDGLTTFMWTGAYRVPVPTLTGDVQADITLVDKVIGVGELAISDHRSSWPSYQELVRIVSDARVAGLLAGKSGLTHFHVGSAPAGIQSLFDIANNTTIPITNMYPTHMSSRGQALIDQAKQWILAGGICDFTADDDSENDTLVAILSFDQQGVPLSGLSVSSDAFGSSPTFDSKGNLIGYGIGDPITDLRTIQNLVLNNGWPLDKALQFSTINPARFLGLSAKKGIIQAQADGDLLILDGSTLNPLYVFARGQVMMTPSWIKTGMFE